MAARFAFETLSNIPTVAVPSAELALYPDSYFGPNRVIILISRSGEKRDVMSAARKAKRAGGTTVAITATPDSLLAGAANMLLLTHEGSEHCQPKTKSYICILATLLQMAIELVDDPEQRALLSAELRAVPAVIEQIIRESEPKMKQLALRLVEYHSMFLTGSASCYGSAIEAALKLKETSFVKAEAFTTGEVTQGPMLLLTDKWAFVSFVLSGEAELAARIIAGAKEWGAFTMAITQNAAAVENAADLVVRIPGVNGEVFAGLTHIVPIYFLAYYISRVKNLDADNPLHFDRILELILEPGRAEPEMRK